MSTLCPSCPQHSSAVGCGHSFPETVLVSSFSTRRLECSFHDCMLLLISVSFDSFRRMPHQKERKDRTHFFIYKRWSYFCLEYKGS